MNGRCQGFFCGAEVQRRLDEAVHPRSGTPVVEDRP
jgi:hypothetical protein